MALSPKGPSPNLFFISSLSNILIAFLQRTESFLESGIQVTHIFEALTSTSCVMYFKTDALNSVLEEIEITLTN